MSVVDELRVAFAVLRKRLMRLFLTARLWSGAFSVKSAKNSGVFALGLAGGLSVKVEIDSFVAARLPRDNTDRASVRNGQGN